MRLAPVLSHLKTACPALKTVGGAADYAAVKQLLKHQLPAAFVIPLGDMDQPSEVWGEVHQSRRTAFAVVLASSNLKSVGGLKDVDANEALRDQVRDALLGWMPPGCDTAVEAAGGKLLDFDDNVLWWQDDYSTGLTIRSK